MDIIYIIEAEQVISIGILIATFLLNTNRVQKAIELLQECLILPNTNTLEIKTCIYYLLFMMYRLIYSHTNAIKCGRELLALLRESGEKAREILVVTFHLAELYKCQAKYNKAKELYTNALSIVIATGERQEEASCYENLGTVFQSLGDYDNAIKHLEKALAIRKEIDDINGEATCYANLGAVFQFLGEYSKAKEHLEKALAITKEIGYINGEASCYANLGTMFHSLCEHAKAKEHLEKALTITKKIGNKKGEASCYANLGRVFQSLGEYAKAKEHLEKALVIEKEIGDINGEASSYGSLGTLFHSIGEYAKAKEHLENALVITKEIGDINDEASCYAELGKVFQSLGEHAKAKEYLEKALAIKKAIGNINWVASCYTSLGTVFQSVSEYAKAKEHIEKALLISKEIGDVSGEASCYANLGTMFHFLCEYAKAKEYLIKALAIRKEIGEKRGVASCYANLGSLFENQGKYAEAKEHLEKALAIRQEIGDISGEASCYANLGMVFQNLGKYAKAKEVAEKALAITKKIGAKEGEALSYVNLGKMFQSFGEYAKAKEHLEKALAIREEIGDKNGEATCYANLGTVFQSLGDYDNAIKRLEKGLAITKEIGDKHEEALCYANLGKVFLSRDKKACKAKEHLETALAINKEIGDINGEASCYGNLGMVLLCLGEYTKAKEHYEKALVSFKEIGNIRDEVTVHASLGFLMMLHGNIDEATFHLLDSIHKSEEMRHFLRDNDQLKISLFDTHLVSYRLLTALFVLSGKPNEALYTVELVRARALADLMSAQYSLEIEISVNPRTWVGIERIMDKESDCSCLYISYYKAAIFLWVIKADKSILFRQIDVNNCFVNKGEDMHVEEVFGNEICRKFHFSPREQCEDRSWFSNVNHATSKSFQEEEDENQQPHPTLAECYKMIIAPAADLLDETEIIIVPDRSLFKVPFAALEDESGKFLSENFMIRIVPSLTTLNLIQDSPADYHSQTGALIVGDPDVGEVLYKGRCVTPQPLPSAKEEAEIIGGLLGVQPLLGKQATKQVVLQRIQSASLIHFAAHGDAERGEIVLSPQRPTGSGDPREEDYLLTMSDISQVRLRAKLVVLSCCHSARGHIRAEGVVGIARAFLGSGARSVLVALWAIEEIATKEFMIRFYENLIRGESASASLYHAMKWMRSNGFSEVGQWAPFMLIGDNVALDFHKLSCR